MEAENITLNTMMTQKLLGSIDQSKVNRISDSSKLHSVKQDKMS